ncbi:hypothetical protein [Klebsiella pneumoniae]|uniref:hypothetical protein n=1 Tax=Klebsiella pneumoniae TaxID=573 RepID=UPI00249BCA87|nr:hypothetical protein [Klebsiella pneumoniae]MDI2691981.1 hypothetical protein [Klebsiella pneumoniae]MDI2819243.1 hypothetical protein [Klebsiella pneumoniae]MDI6487156.1 hypothetical protein [Klebsiella pneumoniae]
MKNEVEQIALQNDMSIEFVTWFFNEKKVGCGNVWFMMMAAMWEGWKGRSIEMDKLAAENVEAKKIISECREYFIAGVMNRIRPTNEGYLHMICDTFADETPATDRIVAGIKTEGAEACVRALVTSDDDDFTDAPNICAMVAYQLRDGGNGE